MIDVNFSRNLLLTVNNIMVQQCNIGVSGGEVRPGDGGREGGGAQREAHPPPPPP